MPLYHIDLAETEGNLFKPETVHEMSSKANAGARVPSNIDLSSVLEDCLSNKYWQLLQARPLLCS